MTWVRSTVRSTLFILISLGSVACSTSPITPYPQLLANVKNTQSVPLDSAIYKLASGDVVKVDVLGEPELTLKVLIDPAGAINYPFLGRVQAAGLTVGQLEQRIYLGLKSGFLVNPDVRVAVAEYRPIYVSGQVRQAGAYPYTLGLTVDKTLTLAGGMTTFGSANRIYLQKAGKSKEERENVGLDSPVYPGDTVVVEERLF